MKFSDIGPDLAHGIGGLFQIGCPGRIRVETEIAQRGRKYIVGGIQHLDAAIPETGQVLRFENDVPAFYGSVRTAYFLPLLSVVADPGGAPHVIGAVLIAGIIDRELAGYDRPGVA